MLNKLFCSQDRSTLICRVRGKDRLSSNRPSSCAAPSSPAPSTGRFFPYYLLPAPNFINCLSLLNIHKIYLRSIVPLCRAWRELCWGLRGAGRGETPWTPARRADCDRWTSLLAGIRSLPVVGFNRYHWHVIKTKQW